MSFLKLVIDNTRRQPPPPPAADDPVLQGAEAITQCAEAYLACALPALSRDHWLDACDPVRNALYHARHVDAMLSVRSPALIEVQYLHRRLEKVWEAVDLLEAHGIALWPFLTQDER